MLKYSLALLLLTHLGSALSDTPPPPPTAPTPAAGTAQPAPPSFTDDQQQPTDAAGKLALVLLDLVNRYNEPALRKLYQEQFSAALQNQMPWREFQETMLAEFKQTGGYTFHSQRRYQPARPTSVLILRDAAWGAWGSISVALDEQGKLNHFNFGPARPPRDFIAPKLTQAQMLGEAKKMVTDACAKQIYSGTLLMAQGEMVLLTHACGAANKRYQVNNRLDTQFNLGSMNKMFTAVALAQLVEQGKLTYDDKVSQYLDESWLPKELADKITLHHLLTHTSGLGSYFNKSFFDSSRLLYRELNDYKPLLKNEKLAFEPGTRFGYSNTGMLLAGAILEQASGQTISITPPAYLPTSEYETQR